MKLSALVLTGTLALTLCAAANAEVVDLNNQSATECSKQLNAAKGKVMVVAAYDPECHWWQKYKPIYSQVSDSINYPASFFRFDFMNAADNVALNCLQEEPPVCPTTFLYNKAKHHYVLVRKHMGYQTQDELGNFISRDDQGSN